MKSDELTVDLMGDFNAPQSRLLGDAFLRSDADNSRLPDWICAMEGMSGRKYRYLINDLVGATPDAAYLEIGTWSGSTACAAMFGNRVKALCVDNWAWFGGPKDEFTENVGRCLTADIDFSFIEADFRTLDYASLGRFNIYMYDGPHSAEDTCRGITLAQDALADVYTLILDDWNWPSVRQGAHRALESLKTEVIAEIVIRTTQDGSHPRLARQESDWHNGYLLAVCRKRRPLARRLAGLWETARRA